MNEVLNVEELFASKVFTLGKMREYLPKGVFKEVKRVMDQGGELSLATADVVAKAMKDWAIENGATHYTHWFQPLTGITAEKHDAFVTHPDEDGKMLMEFSGKELIKGEPDASSFPSGGLRATFEARGYTAWDITSPAFIKETATGPTLCIPTAFCSYTGEALDKKTPLLRSMEALSREAIRIVRLFGNTEAKKVLPSVGAEQEYFLVDAKKALQREDIIFAGRTLFGAPAPKGQEMDDHYFGTIPERVQAFMKDLEIQALELGIPCKTRHNEVAPNQFELAPIYEECNLAVDHNMLLMSLMKRVAHKHSFRVLLHEKPFAGVNGSGKHNNWSLCTDTGVLLHAAGKTPEDNLRFVVFIVETLMGVYKHNGLLKASIMSATNAHRLGANEAPPAIISSFLGKQLTDLLDHIEKADKDELFALAGKKGMELDIPEIPELMIDNTDRNRTSPFAFTGNRFEFRAVGSEANCASSLIVLNAAVAEALEDFKTRVDALIAKGEDQTSAIIDIVREDIKTCKPIRFDGNGYSDEWKEEAQKRGLDCEASCPVVFDRYLDKESIEMFAKTNVMSESELKARNEVKWETYTKKIQIEARVMGDLSMNHIIPVATHYQSRLAKNVEGMIHIFGGEEGKKLTARNVKIIREIAERTESIERGVEALVEARKVANKIENEREKAVAYHDTVAPKMEEIRYQIDKLELLVADELWTLPKYRELLFIR